MYIIKHLQPVGSQMLLFNVLIQHLYCGTKYTRSSMEISNDINDKYF